MSWLIAVLVAIIFVLVLILLTALKKDEAQGLNERLIALENEVRAIEGLLSEKFSEMGTRLDLHLTRSGDVMGDVREKLGRLEEVTRSIQELATDMTSLQTILKPPSVRGAFGETMLERILRDVLPARLFRLQFRLPSGHRVDAAVLLKGRIIPIDAKFPLNNFRKMAESPNSREKHRRAFLTDVRHRIDEISSKYIRPEQGTMDFAIMYIPAEGVYYEAFVNSPETYEYALSKKVIPVSPGTFYLYLHTLLFGLRGVEIEKKVHQVVAELSALSTHLARIQNELDTLGEHIRRSQNKYESLRKGLEDILLRLNRLTKGGLSDEKGH